MSQGQNKELLCSTLRKFNIILYFFHFSEKFKNYLCNDSNMEEILKDFARVTIYNKRLSVVRIEEVAAYSLDQLFSDIGL